MIKRLTTIALAIGLGSCSGTSSPPLSLIDQIEQGAIVACGYAPSVVSISAILGSFIPGVGGVGPIVTEICQAVNALKTPMGAMVRAGAPATVMVRGVAVHGVFTR